MKLVISLNLEELGPKLMKQVIRDAIKLEEKVNSAKPQKLPKVEQADKSGQMELPLEEPSTPAEVSEPEPEELPKKGTYVSAHRAVRGYLRGRKFPKSDKRRNALKEEVYAFLFKLSNRGDFELPSDRSINTYILKWTGR